ncbi:hypothetical protein LZG04_19065 [Saccharothrix sp. S26]|uniref:hypothetical protein n=1 Tax=Saccharothrix sp. S26 TaxID=2907215 RepID=UPI001F3ACA78|nr:hypothetical protein [Saccharothrix sp. S26]MCE6996888.1 hypothetical protein [Saccharothrix sp. S26]
MTTHLVPEPLRALPRPWSASDFGELNRGVKALPPDAANRTVALSALEHSLDFLAEHRDDPEPVLPEAFHEQWFVVDRKFAADMPSLADVTVPAIRDWLGQEHADRLRDVDGPALTAEAVEQFWVSRAVGELTTAALHWLRTAVRDTAAEQDRDRLVALLKDAVPRVDDRTAVQLLGIVLDVAAIREIPYFAALEHDQAAPQPVRRKAAQLRVVAETRAAEQPA